MHTSHHVLIALLCVTLTDWTQGKRPETCSYEQRNYECRLMAEHEVTSYDFPPDSCHIRQCHHCLKTWRTVIVHEGRMIEPSHFISRQLPSDQGPRTLISCKSRGLPCTCDKLRQCSGDTQYCQYATCSNGTEVDCHCELIPANTSIVHRANGLEIINPTLVSFQICAAEYPHLQSTQHRHKRRILTNEEAVFVNEHLKLTFTDPILTASHPGVIIIRIDGQEKIVNMHESPYQAAIPPEMMTQDAELSIIFISTTGSTLKGAVHIQGREFCTPLKGLMCPQLFRQLKCLPTVISYVVYGTLALLTAVTFIYVKIVITTLCSIIRITCLTAWKLIRLIRGSTLLAVKTGAATGAALRNRGRQVQEYIERRLPQPAAPIPAPATLAVLALILCVNQGMASCNTHHIIAAKARECTDTGVEKTCKTSTSAQIILKNLDYQACLWVTDEESEKNLFSLKVKFSTARCVWQTQREYYTYATEMRYLSQLICVHQSTCSWGRWCVPGNTFPAMTKQSMEWPGVTNCHAADSGSAPCLIIDSQHCHFYRIWLEADFLKSYEVRRITGLQCEYGLEVEQHSNGSTETLQVKAQAVTSTGINVQVIGAMDQHVPIINSHLISRVGNPRESYIEQASPPSRPKAGHIGDVQANMSITKNFIFDEKMFNCNFYEDTMSCSRLQSYLLHMTETKKNALPMTSAWHHFQVDSNGRLTSELLHSAPLEVNLQFYGYRFSLETQTVCPKFGDSEPKISGCYACDTLATLELEAFSSCAPGIVDVKFEKLLIHTRMLRLHTQKERHQIKLKTDTPCINEKLCLLGRTVTTCKVIEFCLEQGSINLVHPNTTYITAQAIAGIANPWDTNWWPATWTFSATGIVKLLVGCLTAIILFLFVMSTLMTCCRGNRN